MKALLSLMVQVILTNPDTHRYSCCGVQSEQASMLVEILSELRFMCRPFIMSHTSRFQRKADQMKILMEELKAPANLPLKCP